MTRPSLVIGALLLAMSARAQPAVDWSAAEPVTVVMVDDRFVPDRLTLKHGVPYQLQLENHDKDLHEFTAPEFFAAAIVRDPNVLVNGGTEVVVQPGWQLVFYLIPVSAGTFRLYCADHDWDGMVGEIVVE
jgi:plastocyanin